MVAAELKALAEGGHKGSMLNRPVGEVPKLVKNYLAVHLHKPLHLFHLDTPPPFARNVRGERTKMGRRTGTAWERELEKEVVRVMRQWKT